MVKQARAYQRLDTPVVANVNNFIRQWREMPRPGHPKGWSQGKLADVSGVSLSSISAYERGENDPSMEFLQMLSDALGVPRGMLLDVDPTLDTELWAVYLRADKGQRDAIGRMAAGLVGGPTKKRK